MAKLRIRWVRSQIGYAQPQRRTIRALGLRRLQHTVVHEDTPTIRGMLHKVRHMIHVEAAEEPQTSDAEKK
ncbi:MAG: 50S ribosomal protein L30 [Chloroflexi bacterium]|nr:50S ribosomal protein L30 [Chloroflexota bacterium]